MGIEANKALVRRWVEEVWNEGKLELIDELASEQFVLHHTSFPQQTIDRQTYRQLGPWPLSALPDLHLTIEAMIAEGDLVAVCFRETGTHRGDFRGIAPSNKSVVQPALAVYRCEGGKIVEAWGAERD